MEGYRLSTLGQSDTAVLTPFLGSPTCRVCVEALLPQGQLLQMDCLLHDWIRKAEDDTSHHKHVMHVQSLSHWAPANIGPYSQAVKVGTTEGSRSWGHLSQRNIKPQKEKMKSFLKTHSLSSQ